MTIMRLLDCLGNIAVVSKNKQPNPNESSADNIRFMFMLIVFIRVIVMRAALESQLKLRTVKEYSFL